MAFGVPGGGPNLDVVGALEAADIRFVLAHGETSAAIMASTYGTLTGSTTAAVVTRGPGAASAINGAAQATLDRHPLLLLADTVPAASRARVPHQRIDQQAMFGPVTKATRVLGRDTSVDDLDAAVSLAQAAPAGCVHLDYDAAAPGQPIESPATQAASDQATIDRARDLIAGSKHPVVIVGLEANRHASQVRGAVEAFGAPVLSTYQGVGVVATESDLNGGLFTNGASERTLLDQADVIIMVGVDLVEPIPAAWAYDALVVAINDAPPTDDYLPVACQVIGDIGEHAIGLVSGSHEWPPAAGIEHRSAVRALLAGTAESDVLSPVALVQACANAAPPQATTTVDAGAHFLAIMPFWPTDGAQRLLISNGLATMGYAVPAAIGAALARPGEPVVALTGDGGLGMCLAELETIVRLDLPITVVVFNDAALSLIEIKQRDGHGGPGAVKYRRSDFAAIAAGMGMRSITAATAEEVAAGFGSADGGPLLIDAQVDPASYPGLIHVTRG